MEKRTNPFGSKDYKWSYSSLSTFEECPLAFKLHYIQQLEDKDSAFTQYGKLVHSILERYYKKELNIFELADIYRNEYCEKVTDDFPVLFQSLEDLYYDSGESYFETFDDDFFDYKVIAVEQRFLTKIGEYSFTGVIDLILQDGEDYLIVDHKSKSKFKSKKEHQKYLRQLYLYSMYIYETYGKYPKKLIFNLIRSKDVVEADFDYQKYQDTLAWAENTIKSALSEKVFEDKIKLGDTAEKYKPGDDFYCSKLCSMRTFCVRSDAF